VTPKCPEPAVPCMALSTASCRPFGTTTCHLFSPCCWLLPRTLQYADSLRRSLVSRALLNSVLMSFDHLHAPSSSPSLFSCFTPILPNSSISASSLANSVTQLRAPVRIYVLHSKKPLLVCKIYITQYNRPTLLSLFVCCSLVDIYKQRVHIFLKPFSASHNKIHNGCSLIYIYA